MVDTTNKFGVGRGAISLAPTRGLNDIVITLPVPQRLSQDDALLLAAYIVATVADSDKWEAVLTAVETAKEAREERERRAHSRLD